MVDLFSGKEIVIYKEKNLWHFVRGCDFEIISFSLQDLLRRVKERMRGEDNNNGKN